MRRPYLAFFGVLAGLSVAPAAQADVIPSGRKAVTLSIQVRQAERVPEGHRLFVINTWEGATELPPGETVEIQWHPFAGKLQLVSADPAQRKQLEAIAEKIRGPGRLSKMQARSNACAAPFDGLRTVKDSERYDEIRWVYSVHFEGETCRGKLDRLAYLAEGEELEAPPKTSPFTAPADEKAATSKEKGDAPKASGCHLAPPGNASSPSAAALALVAAALGLGHRRRR